MQTHTTTADLPSNQSSSATPRRSGFFMQKKVIYKDGKLVEIKKVYILYDDEGNVIRKSDYHIPFSISKKEEKIVLDFNELEDALL